MRVDESQRIGDRWLAPCRDLIEAAAGADAVRPVSEQGLLNLDPRATGVRHLLAHDEGELAGYAQLDEASGGAELVVHPAHRRRGAGTALLRAVEHAAGPDRARVWAHGFVPAARAFAQARDLRVVRELWQMTLPLTSASEPDVALAEGFTVRPFTEADLDEWVAVNARAFASHPEQGRVNAADVRDRMAQPWFDADGFLLVHETSPDGTAGPDGSARGRLAAYHWTKIDPGEQPPTGEVYVVGIDPAYQGRGLARSVTGLGLAHLIGRGVERITLYVDGDNERAIATYRAAGFERTALDVVLASEHGAQ